MPTVSSTFNMHIHVKPEEIFAYVADPTWRMGRHHSQCGIRIVERARARLDELTEIWS